jgi:rare lipoprotein A
MNIFTHSRLVILISLFVITSVNLTGCTSSRYKHSQDFLPNPILDPSTLKDAVVKAEPLSAMGNPDKYTVFGKEYYVMDQSTGFKQEGYASWYGMKFHGHATSNGEIYDVYQMTAAHKTLPLPSYVRVTRKDTQESLIVRVNDRGPFHEGRIIDLSYAAAVKLGINKVGVAEVSIEVVSSPVKGPENWLQVSALSNEQSAIALQKKLQEMQQWPVIIDSKENRSLHKVRIGPIPVGQATEKVVGILLHHQLPTPLVLAEHQL